MPYMPILKVKQGEMIGLDNLVTSNTSHLELCLPLLEINPCQMDVETDIPKNTTETHIEKALKLIARKWANRRFLLDFKYVMPFVTQPQEITGSIPIMQQNNLMVTPVFKASSLGFDVQAALAISQAMANGVAIRYYISDVTDFSANLPSLLQAMQVGPQDVDLVYDFEANLPEGVTVTAMQTWAQQNMAHLASMGSWRSITITGSSFPSDYTDFGAGSLTFIPRGEWNFWKAILSQQRMNSQRLYSFGDYGPLPIAPAYYYNVPMQPAAKIRYTIENNWMFLKGLVFATHGGQQFRQMCVNVMTSPEFRSRVVSWGDEFIEACANQSGSTGNLATWVSVGVNRHVAFCLNQLASLNAL